MTQESGPPNAALVASNVKSQSHPRSHGHLTNNIHLRNLIHMQKHRVVLTEARISSELPLMKELTVLRRARSLRDPSTSPAWSISSSHGNRRLQGTRAELGGSGDARRNARRFNARDKDGNSGGKREKLDLRVGGHLWVGEFIVEDAADQLGSGSDQKENNVLKSNGMRDVHIKPHKVVEKQDAKPKAGNKKGIRLEKSRSYPWLPPNTFPAQEEELAKSRRKPGRKSGRHSERENVQEERVVAAGGATEEVEVLVQKGGSLRAVDSDWVLGEPERRAEIARRVISETVTSDDVQRDGALASPPALAAAAHRELSDLFSVMDLAELRCEGDAPENGDSEEDSLRNQLPASDTQSSLLHRDSMTTSPHKERLTTRVRRVPNKRSGLRDVERRQREGTGKAHQRRLRGGRASSLRASGLVVSGSGSGFGMEGELDVSELPRNGCGAPWYWTRMQTYRGKRLLGLAGKSLACGLTEGPRKKDDKQQQQCGSRGDLTSTDRSMSFDGSGVFPDRRSSDFEHPSMHFDSDCGGESPTIIPRADGDLLNADRSGEFVGVSGLLMPSSSAVGGNKSPGAEENLSWSDKYRPRSLDELLGQNMVATSLRTAILKGKFSSVYLFHGPRGTGKSSAARIFAQALNCSSERVDLTRPCGLCAECTNPARDTREFDASNDGAIDRLYAVLRSVFGTSSTSPRCRALVIDDCHWLTANAWNLALKALENPPLHVVFILTTTDTEKVPRPAISRSQKFLFSKIKEGDIVNRLQFLAKEEGLDVEESALSLVAARSQGSLRDAEATLEQLSLLGKRISLSLVQDMAGLVSDEKLVDLLDLAMSAEAVDTVQCMRELLDGGVEPLTLVTQLATLITDILAGIHVVSRDKLKRGFFFRSSRKEEAVRLSHALKILSEAEKQLRLSNDQPTWLTAALLQFAPDKSFQPSSVETSVLASPVQPFNDTSEKETLGDSIQPLTREEQTQCNPDNSKGGSAARRELQYLMRQKKNSSMSSYSEAKIHPVDWPLVAGVGSPEDRLTGRHHNEKLDMPLLPGALDDLNQREFTFMSQRKLEEVWQRVLQGSRSNVLRQVLQGQGKLLSLLHSDAFGVAHLEFRHPEHKARAERSRSRICNAFQMALGCPVELQITLACMPSEHQLSFTTFDNQAPIFDRWQKDKAKCNALMVDLKSFNSKGSSRLQQTAESMDISESLYNAVMGDSRGFKPEILPVVSSSKWGRDGGHLESPRDKRKFLASMPQDLRHSENQRIIYGPPLSLRVPSGKAPLKTGIHQHKDSRTSPNQELQTDVFCGARSRRKSVKFKDSNLGHSTVNSGHTASFEQQKLRPESLFQPSQIEPCLLCWRVQRMDEDKIKMQRRRRQRRVKVLLKLVPCTKSPCKHYTVPRKPYC